MPDTKGSVGEKGDATGHSKAAIYWHLQRIYQKHSISRQAGDASRAHGLLRRGTALRQNGGLH